MMRTSWLRTRRKWRDPPSGRGWERNHDYRTCVKLIHFMLLLSFVTAHSVKTVHCPPSDSIPGCPCYNFEDGLFLECAGSTEESIRSALLSILHMAGREGKITFQQYSRTEYFYQKTMKVKIKIIFQIKTVLLNFVHSNWYKQTLLLKRSGYYPEN